MDKLIRKLKNLEKDVIKIKLSIPSDEDGFSDRECPNEECKFEFKVHEDDRVNKSKK